MGNMQPAASRTGDASRLRLLLVLLLLIHGGGCAMRSGEQNKSIESMDARRVRNGRCSNAFAGSRRYKLDVCLPDGNLVVSAGVCFWGFAEAMLVVNFGWWNIWGPSRLMKDGENQEGV